MPEWLHKQLAQAAAKKGLKGKQKDAYIYGTLQRYEESKQRQKARTSALTSLLRGKKK